MFKVSQPESSVHGRKASEFFKALDHGGHYSLVDLLIRESIQNSLDAASPGQKSVQVHFNIMDCSAGPMLDALAGARERLKISPMSNRVRVLEVRDTGTKGLTGPIDMRDPESDADKFGKLIFGLARTHTDSPTAGGSWGFGKTMFYRLGAGLVIYYTRCVSEGRLVDRVAAVGLQAAAVRRFPFENGTGIHWWTSSKSDKIEAIESPASQKGPIREMLRTFGVEPFQEKQTGTSVIVPFLKDDEDLARPESFDSQEWNDACHWERKLENALERAAARWYPVRLGNASFPQLMNGAPSLEVSVNGSPVVNPTVCRKLQELYFELRTQRPGRPSSVSLEPITLYRKQGSGGKPEIPGGRALLAFREYDKSELGAIDAEMLLRRDVTGTPLIAGVRSLGMALSWHQGVDAKPWSTCSLPEGRALIGLVMPDPASALEEALRKSERAEHTHWIGEPAHRVGKKVKDLIQKKVQPRVNLAYTDLRADGRAFAAAWGLFGLGREPTIAGLERPETGVRGGGAGRPEARSFEFSAELKHSNNTGFEWRLKSLNGRKARKVLLAVEVQTESGNTYDEDGWKQEFGTPFPYEIRVWNQTRASAQWEIEFDDAAEDFSPLLHRKNTPILGVALVCREVPDAR
jgi:hypothetical protein